MQPSPQRALIDRLRAEFGLDPSTGAVSNNRICRNLENAVRILSEQLNTELAHFLLELVQNADDLTYRPGTRPSLIFRLIKNQLLVISNETGFTDRDVESICSVGDSTKAGVVDQTGEKGIGFKSLFKASEEVTIASNGFHFQFSLNRPCGSVVPEWKLLPQQYQLPQYSSHTIFLLTFNNQRKLAKVKDELLAFESKLLLFLRRLKTVEIDIDGKVTRIERQDTGTGSNQQTTLKTLRPSVAAHTSSYAIVAHAFPVTVTDQARINHTSTTVTLAFPLGAMQETCQAYNCLPIATTGFPFLLQGDFILSASREGLNETNSDWNDMLFEGLAEAFLQASRRFNASSELRYTWLKYLPRNPPHSQFKRLSVLVQNKLQSEYVLLTQSGDLSIPSKAFYVPKMWRDSSNQPLVQHSSLSPPNLSCGYETRWVQHLSWVGCKIPNSTTLLIRFRAYVVADNGASFRKQPIPRLSAFALALLDYQKSELETLPIIPVKGGHWITPRGRVIFFPQNANEGSSVFEMPQGLAKVEVVMSQYVSGSEAMRRLFAKLGVQQGSVPEVCKMIEEAHGKVSPPSLDRQVLIQHTTYLFNASRAERYVQPTSAPKSLWLCTETDRPVLSRHMYQPLALIEKAILPYIGQDINSRQVMHSDYLSNIAPNLHKEFSQWLLKQWKVMTWLRICNTSPEGKATSQRTDEFQTLLSRRKCYEFLSMLVNSWHENFGGSSPPAFVSSYGTLKARWDSTKTEEVPLEGTFLHSKAVQDLAPSEVPFLRVPDPDDPKWQHLRDLGVVTTATPHGPQFWLACIRSLMQGTPTRATMLQLYEKLNSICSHQANVIRPFFEKNAAIFIPSRKTWIKPTECIWASKYSIHHKCILSPIEYPSSLEPLFRLCIGVNDAQIDDVIAELKLWRSEDHEANEYLRSLFLALQSTFKSSTEQFGIGRCKEKLKVLRNVKFVPLTKTHGSDIEVRAGTFSETPATPDWFVVDSLKLQDAFRDQVWLLDFSLEESQKLKPFIRTLEEVFGTTRAGLSSVVKEQSQHSGKVVECTNLTQLLRTRSLYFGSAAKAGRSVPGMVDSRINRLANASVLQTERISTDLTISSARAPGGLIRGSSRLDTDIMLEDSSTGLKVYILSKAAGQGRLPPSTGDSLGNYLCVTNFEHLHLIGHILMAYSQRDVRDLLVSRGIPVDPGGEEDDEAEAPTNEQFQGSVLQTKTDHEPSSVTVETSLPVRTSEPDSVNSSSGGSNGRGGRGRGRGGTATASNLRSTASSSYSPSPATQVAPTTATTNSTFHSSGPRRTDGASRAVEITASQKQDPKTGVQGELTVYSMLKKVLGDDFKEEHWTSELRHLADKRFKPWKPKDDTTFYADLTFIDTDRNLTDWLSMQELIDDNFATPGKLMRYHIEVKATSGKGEDPYHMSDWQFEEMKRMAQEPAARLSDGTEVVDKFLVFRVSGIGGNGTPNLKIVTDPWKVYADGKCKLRAPGGMWVVWK